MIRRVVKLQKLVRNFTPHNFDRFCPNTIVVGMVSHTDVIPKVEDNSNVDTQIVLSQLESRQNRNNEIYQHVHPNSK
jgi:hypothetical protein